jgi:dephospho-CoA kinase
MPIENKRMLAAHLIDNSGTREATRGQVDRIWREALAVR